MSWPDGWRFLLGALAVWRVSFLLARETGPRDMFSRFRQRLGDRGLGRVFRCVKCLSLWVAMPMAFYVAKAEHHPIDRLVTWLALSGVAALIDEFTKPPFEWRDGASEEVHP